MAQLSEYASFLLDRMEPERRYDARQLRGLGPDLGMERLREAMHELWINRCVERMGDSAWRRHQSASPHHAGPVSGEFEPVKPEELFDHATFADFFK